MFHQITIHPKVATFDTLHKSTKFEPVIKGRQGTVLIKPTDDNAYPIVRTTTKYRNPAQIFKTSHQEIAELIETNFPKFYPSPPTLPKFNNALIEIYTNQYKTMGFHSDQATDLKSDSYIAIYSTYNKPELLTPETTRKLIVKDKTDPLNTFIIPLTNNSVVIFTTETNKKYVHKIVMECTPSPLSPQAELKWMGLTLRESKTHIRFTPTMSPIIDTTESPLRMATDEESKTFYKMRHKENKGTEFKYPSPLKYTLSFSDLLPPTDS